MAMKPAVLLGMALLLGAGCSTRPSEEACEKAVGNIRKLTGQSQTEMGADKRAAIRSCRAQSSKETVECMAEARTSEELFACGGKLADEVRKHMEQQKKESAAEGKPTPGGAIPPGAPPIKPADPGTEPTDPGTEPTDPGTATPPEKEPAEGP